MKLADKLNKYSVSYDTDKNGVTLDASPEDDSLFDADGNVTDADFSTFLDELDTFVAYVDDDPRDRRAGLVCFVEHGVETAWYDANGECAWC